VRQQTTTNPERVPWLGVLFVATAFNYCCGLTLSRDEARRIAAKVAKLPELLRFGTENKRGRSECGPSVLCFDRALYCVQTFAMGWWHHCPFWHSNGRPLAAVPQAHVAAACWPTEQPGIVG
jgi:hypothetical protein